jgi:uncharacterized protein YdaU (DUF1376 family)
MSLAFFPLFPTDFDADTGHLSFAEDGAYNRLLRLSWRCPEAKMPDDLDWICRKARAVSEADRALIEAILSEFFTRKSGKIFSRRLHDEWVKAKSSHEKKISAGSKGGAAKALNKRNSVSSNAVASLYQPEPEPEPEPEPQKEESFFGSDEPQKARVSSAQKEAEKRFDEFWDAYPKKSGKPSALRNWLKAIRAGADPSEIILGAVRYAGSEAVQRGFAKHPQGWLTDERWKDDDLPPVRQTRFQPPIHEEVYR